MGRTEPLFARPQPILYWVVGVPLAFVAACSILPLGVVVLVLCLGGVDTFDPNKDVRRGEAAVAYLRVRAQRDLFAAFPESARNGWCYEASNFGDGILYALFDCENREDCLKAVEYLGHLRPDELRPWEPSRYAAVMEGPDFHLKGRAVSRRLAPNPWDVGGIRNGLVYESIVGDHPSMVYYAIDLDRNRVYYHDEGRGFPAAEDRPKDSDEELRPTGR